MKNANNLQEPANYDLITKELEKSYNSYIKNKEAAIEIGIFGGTVGTLLLGILLGPMIGVPMGICAILSMGKAKEAYKKELLQALSIGELGDVEEIEKYYKQLPKDLREEWLSDNVFSKLADHLKMRFPDEQELVDFKAPADDWVVVSGDN